MPFPGADQATIPADKILEYLLNPEHPVGGPKAAWFLGLGYRPDTPEVLERDVLEIAHVSDDFDTEHCPHGVKYIVRGRLTSPLGRHAKLTTVWILEPHLEHARLVTAYPAGGS